MTRAEGNAAEVSGRILRAAFEEMEDREIEAGRNQERSLHQFRKLMVEHEKRQRRRHWVANLATIASAIAAAMTSAGAYRILTR